MHFYKLSNDNRFDVEFADGNDWEGIICQKNEGHQRAGRRITELKIDLPSSKLPHFLWTLLSDCIITDEVAKLFAEACFTGYILKPVIVSLVKEGDKKEIPPLWEMVITGKGGKAHPKSGIKLKYQCSDCGMERYTDFGRGLYIDETQWDGSDFFTIWPLPKFILVTRRVRDFIVQRNLTNCKLVLTEKLIGAGEGGGLGPN